MTSSRTKKFFQASNLAANIQSGSSQLSRVFARFARWIGDQERGEVGNDWRILKDGTFAILSPNIKTIII